MEGCKIDESFARIAVLGMNAHVYSVLYRKFIANSSHHASAIATTEIGGKETEEEEGEYSVRAGGRRFVQELAVFMGPDLE